MPPPLRRPAAIDRGRKDRPEVALTFDGGGDEGYAREILATLREKGVRTTIFLTGKFIRRNPSLVREMAGDGHVIGNHTYSHPHLTTYQSNRRQETLPGVDRAFIRRQLLETARICEEAAGVRMAPLWRAPYGDVNERILRWGLEAGYTHAAWTSAHRGRESLDSLDWVADRRSRLYRTAGEIEERIVHFDHDGAGLNGGIILMHLDTRRKSDQAHLRLDHLIDSLRRDGYHFVTVPQLIRARDLPVAVAGLAH